MVETPKAQPTFAGSVIPKNEDWNTKSDYGKVNRQLLFTIHNNSGIALLLVDQNKWYGFLDAPNHYVPPTGDFQVRGYKRSNNATGVTFRLTFQLDPVKVDTTCFLCVYLQVGYSVDNYFGYLFTANPPSAVDWYKNAQFDTTQVMENDFVLYKGGKSIIGSFFANQFTIQMTTDNQSDSFP